MSSKKRIGILRRLLLLSDSNDRNLTSLLVVFLAGNALVAQQACFVGPCLSPPVEPGWDLGEEGDLGGGGDMSQDMYIGPCLSPPLDMAPDMEVDMGPCLSADMPIGPCLTPLPPDMGEEVEMGPCLSADFGFETDMGEGDMGSKDEDMPVGPCLSPPLEDMGAIDHDGLQKPTHEKITPDANLLEKQKLLAKLSDRLPADVLSKLGEDLG